MADDPIVWSRRLVRAAFWVAHVLGSDGEHPEVAHASWIDLPLAGRVDLPELHAAEHGLLAAGLIRKNAATGRLQADPRLQAASAHPHAGVDELLLSLVLEATAPLWLRTATGDGSDHVVEELIPDEAAAGLAAVIPDPARREAFLLACARKVDTQGREELGAEGEMFVVNACRVQLVELARPELVPHVQHVSLVSDELGYDIIAPRTNETSRRLEVKTTRSQATTSVTIFITRNEVKVGLADPDWFLVVVRVPHNAGAGVIGHLSAAALQPVLPEDRDSRGRWQTARVRLPIASMHPGLPPAGT